MDTANEIPALPSGLPRTLVVLTCMPVFGTVILLATVYMGWPILRNLWPMVGMGFLVLSFLVTVSYFHQEKVCRSVMLLVVVWMFCGFQGSAIIHGNDLFFGLEQTHIIRIKGRLYLDSLVGSNGNQILHVVLERCEGKNGFQADSRGTLLAVGGYRGLIMAGTPVELEGSLGTLEDGTVMFSTRSITLSEPRESWKTHIRGLRAQIMQRLLEILGRVGSGPGELFSLLLLGRCDDPASSLKQLGVESGCAHVLALSGMHLQFFSSLSFFIFSRIFGKRWGRRLSLVVLGGFVFITGPIPSLIRSACMQVFSLDWKIKISPREALVLACMAQMFFFPRTVATVGCLLSYCALAGLLLFNAAFSRVMGKAMPMFIARLISTTVTALAFSGPVSMVVFGLWYPIGLVVSPIAGFLATCAMALALLWIVFPLGIVRSASVWLYRLFTAILTWGSHWSQAHLEMGSPGTMLLAGLVLLTVGLVLRYAGQRKRMRSIEHHEMGLSLRFPTCDHRIA